MSALTSDPQYGAGDLAEILGVKGNYQVAIDQLRVTRMTEWQLYYYIMKGSEPDQPNLG